MINKLFIKTTIMSPYNEQTKALILNTINQLINQGGSDNFAIFNLDEDYYIQIAANIGKLEMYCEAVGNNFLDSMNSLNPKQWEKILALGWKTPYESGNYHLTHLIDTPTERATLAELICITAHQIYGVSSIREKDLELNLG